MLKIHPTEGADITKIICPHCNERVRGVGVKKDSFIVGLTFKCRRCGKLWEVVANGERSSEK
jgi:DNA-directed RNA polymerase subunit RPC12/RpoP